MSCCEREVKDSNDRSVGVAHRFRFQIGVGGVFVPEGHIESLLLSVPDGHGWCFRIQMHLAALSLSVPDGVESCMIQSHYHTGKEQLWC